MTPDKVRQLRRQWQPHNIANHIDSPARFDIELNCAQGLRSLPECFQGALRREDHRGANDFSISYWSLSQRKMCDVASGCHIGGRKHF